MVQTLQETQNCRSLTRVLTLSLALCLSFGPTLLGQEKGEDQGKPEKTEKKWDVSAPVGPWTEAAIDTEEGTWLSLDVSPDGADVVFDLLGDIYVVPIGGGEARALTTGVAWDMQPRYSPDGKRIAFTSDRAGGDNIWVMDRDGTNPKAVSSETFRLLNSPAWAPDGQFIAARKHFTAQRSLGSGEIWLYHVAGGEGLQMTKKPNDQKDVGEPAFSPDGRYLYYSRDVTPGPVFEYNKDPNGVIYAIERLDRETGEIETFVSGPGGAVRPTPSPDGKWLAFVRRVRYRSALFLQNVESGEEIPLYDGLDRDMQETWAIHGVYPAMAWTPDSASIVFWAGGKIQRVNLATREVATIPFHVKASRRLYEAVRFPVEVAPRNFDVKMLRWVEVSPQGDRVIYEALGKIYVRDLPDGTPHRLTVDDDGFEYYPSFSRDGRQVVYASWNDQTLGSIRVVPVEGGAGRTVTSRPGHYVEPCFSPDGTRIVFRAVEGGFLTDPKWSRDTGIFSVAASGGDAKLLTKQGFRPQFGASSERVFFTKLSDEKRILSSLEMDGSDPRDHLQSEYATEFAVSPDERWVAFSERFNAYIAPFARTGRLVEIGPKSKAIPIAKVTRDSGEYLHWSGDSRSLHWSLGPELFTRGLTDAFQFLDGAPEKLPEPPESGVNISFTAPYDTPSGKIALVGGRVVTMRGNEIIEDGTVLLEGNRILAVGARDSVPVPADALSLDVTGKTLLPGLIDVHAHGAQGEGEIIPERNWVHYAGLAFGVTTIHDPSNDTSTIFAASEMAKAGLVTAPRIFSTGTILYGATAPFTAEINSLDDAKSHLRRMKAVGAFSVKSYNQPRRDQRQQIMAAARELEMMVVPEGGSLFEHNMTMVVDGHTGIEHSIPVAKIYKDVVQLWSQSKVGYTPTLIVAYGGIWGENYWYQHTNVWENERLATFVPRSEIDPRSRRRMMAPEEEFNHFNSARNCKILRDAGVSVQVGAHGQREGLGAHWELWMLVQGGMSPWEALRAGTLDGAKYLGLDRDLGSLEAGKLADLIVLEKNPLENIRNSTSIVYTIVNGRVYEASTMNQVGNHPGKREKLFWEK